MRVANPHVCKKYTEICVCTKANDYKTISFFYVYFFYINRYKRILETNRAFAYFFRKMILR